MKMFVHVTSTLCILLGHICLALQLGAVSSSGVDRHSASPLPNADPASVPSSLFIKQIFEKYGHNGVITLEGFEHLLENLGLGGLTFDSDHGLDEHRTAGENLTFASLHDPSHSHTVSRVKSSTLSPVRGDSHTAGEEHAHEKDVDTESSTVPQENQQSLLIIQEKCLNTTEILANINANFDQPNISIDNFLSLCPIIVYELDQQHCRVGSTKSNPNYHHHHEEGETDAHRNSSKIGSSGSNQPAYYVWFYSSMAVLIISLSGMLCVAIIPVIQRCFYQQLIQYLVALAIGSLTGDALLHLLPHAMTSVGGDGHDHGSETVSSSHSQSVWIGLMALSGICLFFTAEQAINALNSWKQKRVSRKSARAVSGKAGDVELKNSVMDNTTNQNYDSYNYKYVEVSPSDVAKNDDEYYKSEQVDGSDKNLLNKSGVSLAAIRAVDGKDELEKDISSPIFHSNYKFDDDVETVTVEHRNGHHGHGHSHNHAIPATAMATVWMVIAGDGFHNFTDGMAIGAAFSNGLTGGLSTAIAVFCHELPHELGDFALLLKAGMSIRQGLFYNGLSSVLCFFGMLVGLAIGNIQSANAWVFAAAAGMFLYIALVDMIPELHNSEMSGSSLSKFAIQAFGIATGISIMCVIALYEEDLQKTLET